MSSDIFSLSFAEIALLAPLASIALSIIILLFVFLLRMPFIIAKIALILLLCSAWLMSFLSPGSASMRAWGISFDALSLLGAQILLPALLIITFMALEKNGPEKTVSTTLLILLSGLGALTVVLSHNWLVLFLGLQCASIPIYALIAAYNVNRHAVSAAFKYLLLSALAMAFMLFGILLIYALTASLDWYDSAQSLPVLWLQSPQILLLGLAFILVGFGFKLSLFPFHFWAPSVYQRSPFFVLALLLIVVKAALIIAFLRLWLLWVDFAPSIFTSSFVVMAIVSMWLGSLAMLAEKNVIRLIAYLSIAHLGLLLLPLLAHNQLTIDALFLDITAFTISLIIFLWSLKSYTAKNPSEIEINDLRSLFYKNPALALLLCISLFSLAGFPLTPGFVGKYAIIMATMSAEQWWLMPHMLVTSLLSIIALLRFAFAMFHREKKFELLAFSHINKTIFVALIILLAFGAFPEPWILWVKNQSASLAFIP